MRYNSLKDNRRTYRDNSFGLFSEKRKYGTREVNAFQTHPYEERITR